MSDIVLHDRNINNGIFIFISKSQNISLIFLLTLKIAFNTIVVSLKDQHMIMIFFNALKSTLLVVSLIRKKNNLLGNPKCYVMSTPNSKQFQS